MIFELLSVAPLSRQVRSRDGCNYMERAMKLVGWIPPKTGPCSRYLYMLWSIITTLIAIVYVPCGFLISYSINMKKFNAATFLISLQAAPNATGAAIKSSLTFAAIWRFEHANKLLDQLDKFCTNDKERLEIHRTVAHCNLIFIFFSVFYTLYTASGVMGGILNQQLPWNLYNPFLDSSASNTQYYIAMLVESINVSIAVLEDQLADVYPLVYGVLLRCHIKLLRDRVKKLRTDLQRSSEQHYQDLLDCIKNHQLILQYCNILRPVISLTIFIQFLLIGLVLGIALINIMFFADTGGRIATCIFITACLLETFPFCYICDMIIDDCHQLTMAIFQSNWIDADHRYKTTLLYFLHKMQQGIVFMAGGVFTIQLNTNIKVAKFAFSVVTIAKQMNIAEKFK